MEKDKAEKRRRGRPPGPTAQGLRVRRRLYEEAIRLIARRGYEGATLREIAERGGVSPGLLYRYFPSKRAVVLALYDDLSAQYAARALDMPSGRWRDRFLFALRASLAVLDEHRETLAGLVPVLIGDPDEGVFSPSTAFSRRRVQAAFEDAVAGARDAPLPDDARALGRVLYLVHLAVLLFWLLDRTARQSATSGLLAVLEGALPIAAVTLRVPRALRLVRAADALVGQALFGESETAP